MIKVTTNLAVTVGLMGLLAVSAATPSLAKSGKGAFAALPAKGRVLINRPSRFDQRSNYADDYAFWHRYDADMHD